MRARTTLLAAVVSGTALLAGTVLLLTTLDRSLHRSADGLVRQRAEDLALLAARGSLPKVLSSITGEGVGQVFTRGGRVLAASPNIIGRPPITVPASSSTATLRVLGGAPDDTQTEDYRVATMLARSPQGEVTVVAGSSLEAVSEASRTLRRALAVGVPLLTLLVAGGTWLLVGRTLRPVEGIRSEVARISEDDLDRRVPVPPSGDEVSRLALTMNQMLDRLQDGSHRQRDFITDASHELQSPVTSMRAQLEVALGNDGPDWPTTARLLLADTDEMDRLVRDLLFMARTHDGQPSRPVLLDLDDLVLEEAARVRVRAAVTVDTAKVSAAPVCGDPDELRRLVRNLVENAVRHARSVVVLRLSAGAEEVRLDVVDDGAGVAPEDRHRVFDRFWTTDASRTRGRGSGLGLAIARTVAERHGGSLELSPDGPGAHFVVRLPLQG